MTELAGVNLQHPLRTLSAGYAMLPWMTKQSGLQYKQSGIMIKDGSSITELVQLLREEYAMNKENLTQRSGDMKSNLMKRGAVMKKNVGSVVPCMLCRKGQLEKSTIVEHSWNHHHPILWKEISVIDRITKCL